MDARVSDPSSTWGKLKNSLVGSWKQTPDFIPLTRELESWARAVWKLKGGVSVAFLNKDLMLFEFDFLEESNYVMERGCNLFRGGVLNLERWRPESGCVKNKNLRKEAWVRVIGLPLHLWTRETLKQIGDGCGVFLKVDEETGLRSEISWARILVRLKETVRPSTVNILAGSRSYELQIWWELPPWVVEVYPSKMEVGEGLQKWWEEDEYKWHVAKGASSGSAHTKFDWRVGRKGDLMAMQTSEAAARSLRTAPDLDWGYRFEPLETPTVDPPSKAGPEGLSPTDVGTSPIEPRPKGHGLGPGCPSSSRPKDFSQNKARTPSFLPKSTLVRAKDPLLSSAEERYCPPKPLYYPPSSSCLDRIPHLEEFFGHGGTYEISQASDGSESVGSQGIALTPLAILPPSRLTRPLSRELVAVEEREV